ncbi:sugar kinase [Candidatus Woesearchaeota archaeon CG10_big_fil_rev_8_21_14_0_10_44_13]|nr:MAG: sugar kinase [Candidatus Woesearchaeota archaeon CG10_big_fil_rev_8_21_14_0_10_44_13]
MVDIVILGTIGLDDIETPFGKVKEALGGSGTYAAYASSFFAKPGIVSIAGEDLPKRHIDVLKKRNISMDGIEIKGRNFRWGGFYEFDMNEAKTLKTELNSLADFDPELPADYKKAKYVFLGNVDPTIQLKVLGQIEKPELIVMDTMNFWISSRKEELIKAIKKVDVLVLNDSEARQLFGTVNLVNAADMALDLGPKAVIIKKGEHGALLFFREDGKRKHFSAPGYPLEVVKDPTGCGDSFGGGFIGHLAKTKNLSEANMRKAVIYGSVIASFNAEDFSLERQKKLTWGEIERRFHELREIREF